MANDDFEKFAQKKADAAKADTLSLDDEKRIWLEKLDELYSNVESWLTPSINQGSITLVRTQTMLYEEQFGNYGAPGLSIVIGRSTVKLLPVGTFLIGARGRVDMSGPGGTATLLIVPSGSSGPKVTVTVHIKGTAPAPSLPATPPVPHREWVWKIANRVPRISYIELNRETFQATLMDLFGD